mgnify:CR=1 FL=1
MRSATSYFNGPLYRKTLARFWPLWGLWGVFWLFALPLSLLTRYFQVSSWHSTDPKQDLLDLALNLPNVLPIGLFFSFGFAVLCAMAVFGYLYNHRSACWTHALPLRREAIFNTQYLAGLSMILLPQLAACLLAAMVELSFLPSGEWGTALPPLLWLALVQSGVSLFFFSFASFCAMFTGHILALPAFYVILNYLAIGIWFLIDAMLNEFYYGYWGSEGVLSVVEYLTPISALQEAVDWLPSRNGLPQQFRSPGTVAVYAAIGVVLVLISLYVYRRRHVETAGDVVSVALVRPVFKYGVAFCSGLALGLFTAAFFGWSELPVLIPCILFWTVLGYFAAEMLLKKSFRVFKAWKGGAAMAAVMLVLCLACFLDLFGVVERVPASEQVDYIVVDISMGYPYDGGRNLSGRIQDPKQIESILALHQAIVDNRDNQEDFRGHTETNDYTRACLTYRLSNGSELSRRYPSVPLDARDQDTPGTVAYAMNRLVENRELVAQTYGFDTFLKDARLTSAYLSDLYNERGNYETVYLDDYRQELWDAVQKDFAEGNLGVRQLFEYSGNYRAYSTVLIFEATPTRSENNVPDGGEGSITYPASEPWYSHLSVTLTPDAKHTMAVLEKTGIWEKGYSIVNPNT